MGLKFTVHTDGWDEVKEAIARSCSKAEHEVAMNVAKDTAPFVPMLNGVLRNGTRVVGNAVIYPGPYAKYLYYGKVMVDESGNGPRHYIDKLGNEVIKFPKGSRLHATDRDLKFWKPGTCSHWFEASKSKNLKKWLQIAEKAVKDDT